MKKESTDILDRIKDFQGRLWEKKQRDSLSSIAADIIKEIINLRIKLSKLYGHNSEVPGYIPPDVCPHCNRRLPYIALNRSSQRDILDRIKGLQARLAEKKAGDPTYMILQDALEEISQLRGKLEDLIEVK